MLRKYNGLNALTVQRLTKPGRYCDGYGLYLQISKTVTKSWLFRFMLRGKSHEMGLGPIALVSLAEAREKVIDLQRILLSGQDPLEQKRIRHRQMVLETANEMSFDEAAAAYIESHSRKWTNQKHREQWENTLKTYASPTIGALAIQKIDTGLIMKVLEPIWARRTETASRLRGRIESVLNYATARDWRKGENPARWRGHLDKLLPKPTEVTKVEHHAALPFVDMGAFMATLRLQEGIAPRALEFTILTAARTGEALGAKWEEINFDEKSWTVPGSRMKHGRDHRVPLSDQAFRILEDLKKISVNEFVFPGQRQGKSLSNTSMLQVIKKRMNLKITSHGFRSTFRDWASECTSFPNDVVEMALAHTIENKVEAAYRRGDLFLKRRKLMLAWGNYCELCRGSGEVIEMNLKQA